MLKTTLFCEELKKSGYTFYTGVPCSFLKSLINFAINDCEYISAANEGDAVAIASGAYLGGKRPVVLMQNSGLANAVSPLTSLNYIFKIPFLGFVSLRGEKGIPDEPQHELTGQITTDMLEMMKIKWEYLSAEQEKARKQILHANKYIENNQPFFFVVKKGAFDNVELVAKEHSRNEGRLMIEKSRSEEFPTRLDTLRVINSLKEVHTIQLATTGKTGRELYEIEDSPNNFYVVGSMGCVSSLGLGLALARKEKEVIVIDGDGSLIMRLGSLATTGYYRPSNMLHILLDNGTYDSTGGQTTVSLNMNFIQISHSCGYEKSVYTHDLEELETQILEWKKDRRLTFLYMPIATGSCENLGRPTIRPVDVKKRLWRFINGQLATILSKENSHK